MNEFHDWSEEMQAADFDRLVDGALSLNELRAMIDTFDRQPHLWRQCALAFLEAQALQKEIGGLLRDDDLSDVFARPPVEPMDSNEVNKGEGCEDVEEKDSLNGSTPPVMPSFLNGHRLSKQLLADSHPSQGEPEECAPWNEANRKSLDDNEATVAKSHADRVTAPQSREAYRRSGFMTWSRRFAVAASLALAFIVGIVGRTWMFPEDVGSLDRQGGSRELGQQSIGDGLDSPQDETTLVGSDSPVPSGHVRFGFDETQPQGADVPAEQLLEVPFYSGTTLPAPTAIGLDAQIKDRLEQSGVQINTERQIVSLRTQDGRTVLVPLETLEFVPRDTKRRFQ